jgi:tetrahydromethanopterin:alpha-L-glutamate ligase
MNPAFVYFDRQPFSPDSMHIVNMVERLGVSAELVDWADISFGTDPLGMRRNGELMPPPLICAAASKVNTRDRGDRAGRFDLFDVVTSTGTFFLNGSAAGWDKVLTVARLARGGIPVPRTRLVRTQEEICRLLTEWGDCVLKPRFGHAAIDVYEIWGRLSPVDKNTGRLVRPVEVRTWELLARHGDLCAQEYVGDKSAEHRVVVVDNKVVACFRKIYSADLSGPSPRPVIACRYESMSPDGGLAETCINSVVAIGANYAELDVMYASGEWIVLDVNPALNGAVYRGTQGVVWDAGLRALAEDVARRCRKMSAGAEELHTS